MDPNESAIVTDVHSTDATVVTEDKETTPADVCSTKTATSGNAAGTITRKNPSVQPKKRKSQTHARDPKDKTAAAAGPSGQSSASGDSGDLDESDSNPTKPQSHLEDAGRKKRVVKKHRQSAKSSRHACVCSTKTTKAKSVTDSDSDSTSDDSSDAQQRRHEHKQLVELQLQHLDQLQQKVTLQDVAELRQQVQQLQLLVQGQQMQQMQQMQHNQCPILNQPMSPLQQPVPYSTSPMFAHPAAHPAAIAPPVQPPSSPEGGRRRQAHDPAYPMTGSDDGASRQRGGKKDGSVLDYKRVDQVWDSAQHNFKLQDTATTMMDSKLDDYLFHVRRTFDYEGRYKTTVVDIKSKPLRDCLQEIMGGVKGVSLVDGTPKLDPNMLFLFLDDMKRHVRLLKKREPQGDDKVERKKDGKRIETKRQHLKVLIKYIDKDYAQVKNSLGPMLKTGLITFELFWALWKPDTLAYTGTYGFAEEPRVFKLESAEMTRNALRGKSYVLEGKYFEYDGRHFGLGGITDEVLEFRGARKITTLNCYPLQYHKNESQVRRELIERGKKFVALSGVQYKSHQGMAYLKKKKGIMRVNINGRIMVDPAVHRRTNPNYLLATVLPKDQDQGVATDDVVDDDEDGCANETDGNNAPTTDIDEDPVEGGSGGSGDQSKYVFCRLDDGTGNVRTVRMPRSEVERDAIGKQQQLFDRVKGKGGEEQGAPEDDGGRSADDGRGHAGRTVPKPPPEFSDEEYLIATSLVLGFAFTEKMWLEFTISGVKEINWNEHAYESLVLDDKTKDIVKALVESHKYHAAESIDDVIQGKGKGLVAVLHGPPGTGKTLTAEGISELLKCPLYMVSAGELGTDPRNLEMELQKVLDICHAWGAILLLDEADVFLEKRNMHEIHRNALVSIFLRQLEYFQGILFLTTNRVETFDDAFQSRIHIALRYENLDVRAKRAVFRIFIERVRALENVDLMSFSEEDYVALAQHDLNGRQIKNMVRTAQALAVNRGVPLSMEHMRQVLDVLKNFERDLKGGPGYQDAMRSYM